MQGPPWPFFESLWTVDEIARRLRISGFRRATPGAVFRVLRTRWPKLAELRGDVEPASASKPGRR